VSSLPPLGVVFCWGFFQVSLLVRVPCVTAHALVLYPLIGVDPARVLGTPHDGSSFGLPFDLRRLLVRSPHLLRSLYCSTLLASTYFSPLHSDLHGFGDRDSRRPLYSSFHFLPGTIFGNHVLPSTFLSNLCALDRSFSWCFVTGGTNSLFSPFSPVHSPVPITSAFSHLSVHLSLPSLFNRNDVFFVFILTIDRDRDQCLYYSFLTLPVLDRVRTCASPFFFHTS